MKCGFIGILKHFFNFSILVFLLFHLSSLQSISFMREFLKARIISQLEVQYFTTELFAEVSARKYLQE